MQKQGSKPTQAERLKDLGTPRAASARNTPRVLERAPLVVFTPVASPVKAPAPTPEVAAPRFETFDQFVQKEKEEPEQRASPPAKRPRKDAAETERKSTVKSPALAAPSPATPVQPFW